MRWSEMSKGMKIGVVIATVLLMALIGSCLPDEEPPASDTASESRETKKPEPKDEPKPEPEEPEAPTLDAAKLEKELTDNFGGPIEDGCMRSSGDVTWHCLYVGLENSANADRIEVHLDTIGGEDLDALGEDARLHVFNFLGLDNEGLDAITSFVNGVDTGTTYRRDVPLLN